MCSGTVERVQSHSAKWQIGIITDDDTPGRVYPFKQNLETHDPVEVGKHYSYTLVDADEVDYEFDDRPERVAVDLEED
jgi:hypothetical protein